MRYMVHVASGSDFHENMFEETAFSEFAVTTKQAVSSCSFTQMI